MKTISLSEINKLITTILEFAYTDKGNGHYVKCNDYRVELDLKYCPKNCECKDYYYRQSKIAGGACKHMQAVKEFYAPALNDLQNDKKNPIVWVSRRGCMVPVRWTQLSQEEARTYYRDLHSDDYHMNIYA